MSSPSIKLISIMELIDGKYSFNIPNYQRGYRWEKQQIEDLLNDLLSFKESSDQKSDQFYCLQHYQRGYRWEKQQIEDLLNDLLSFKESADQKPDQFYCLQPLVVKKIGNNVYNVIDGQQRLTTIFLILQYLKLNINKNDFYTIKYETRDSSEKFLNSISNTKEINDENIDSFYMSKAYLCIKDWFENQKSDPITSFIDMLAKELNPIKFIWYELREEDDEIKAFQRLNSGQIPLTNAELIKALFLHNAKENETDEKKLRQIEIAKEWDEIEYSLQDDEFFGFLAGKNSKEKYATRIEFLFEILSSKKNSDQDPYAIYRYFADYKENIIKFWSGIDNEQNKDNENTNKNIKNIFLTLKFWFNDSELYHLVGLLLLNGAEINVLFDKSTQITKTQFKEYLKKSIIKNFINTDKDGLDKDNLKTKLLELNYYENKKTIENFLVLFNIATILSQEGTYVRFSFDKFKEEKWSLEHIHARNSKPLSNEEQNKWLQDVKNEIEKIDYKEINRKEEILCCIEKFMTCKDLNQNFENLQNEIFKIFGFDDETKDSISNLALLKLSDNSALSNGIFAQKREIIKERDKNGSFIPICTRNVFVKYYSKNMSKMYIWDEGDRRDYLEEIVNTIYNLLKDAKQGDGNE